MKSTILPWAAALILLITFNFTTMAYLAHNPKNPNLGILRWKWKLLLDSPHEWLILGDSSCLHSANIQLFEDGLGTDAVNLGTFGDLTLMHDYFMLKAYIDKFSPPENVLLIHSFDTTMRNMSERVIAWIPQPWGYWETKEPEILSQRINTLKVWGIRVIPLYFQPKTVSFLLFRPDQWFSEPIRTTDGFVPIKKADPRTFENDWLMMASDLSDVHYQISEDSSAALDKISELAEEHDIDIYYSNGPFFEGMYSISGFATYYNKYISTFKAWTDRSENTRLLNTKGFKVRRASCDSVDHVDSAAASDFTNTIIDEILTIRGKNKEHNLQKPSNLHDTRVRE